MRRTQLLCFAMALLVPSLALADSISPTSVNEVIQVGDTYRLTKTVTVDGITPRDNTAIDVLFLFDTSASMGSNYSNANWLNGTIPGQLVGAASALSGNVQVGVASYVDFPTAPWGNVGDYPYLLEQALTSNSATAAAAMNSMGMGVGNDDPEANLYALNQVATDASIGWRAGSTRLVLWFGDEPGHLGGQSAGPAFPGVTYPGTLDTGDVIAALLGADATVSAFDFASLDGALADPDGGPDLDDNQATRIADQTGGDYFFGWWSNPSDKTVGLSAAVQQALINAAYLYDVDLDLSELLAMAPGLTYSVVTDGAATGQDRRNGTQSFVWDIDITGNTAGIYNFNIYGLLDGVRRLTETDRFDVGGNNPPGIPEPSTIALLGLGLVGVGVVARRRKK